MTGHGDVSLAVRAMKAGAIDFIEKPFEKAVLLSAIEHGMGRLKQSATTLKDADEAATRLQLLTAREREVLDGLAKGLPNKSIAYDLGISPRTVEIHRANLMAKLEVKSLSDALAHRVCSRSEPLRYVTLRMELSGAGPPSRVHRASGDGVGEMTGRQTREQLLVRDEIVAAPVKRACDDQTFEVPTAIYVAMATMFAGFIAVLAPRLSRRTHARRLWRHLRLHRRLLCGARSVSAAGSLRRSEHSAQPV